MNNSTPVSLTVAPTAREVIEKAGGEIPCGNSFLRWNAKEQYIQIWHPVHGIIGIPCRSETADTLLAEAYRQWTAAK